MLLLLLLRLMSVAAAGGGAAAGSSGSKWITATDASNNGWNLATGGAPVSLATLTGLSESDILAALQASGGFRRMRAKVTFYGAGGGGGSGFNGIAYSMGAAGSGGGAGGSAGASMTFWNRDVSATVWAVPSVLALGFGGAGGIGGATVPPYGADGSPGENSYYTSIFALAQTGTATPQYIIGGGGGGGGGGGPTYSQPGPGGGASVVPGYTSTGNWVPATTSAPIWTFGYRVGNQGQGAEALNGSIPQGGVGAAPGFVPDIYQTSTFSTYAPAGPNMALNIMTTADYTYDGPGEAKYGGRWAAGGVGRLYQGSANPPLQAGRGADGEPGGGGGGGGSGQGSFFGSVPSADGGKGGDALMVIEWWL